MTQRRREPLTGIACLLFQARNFDADRRLWLGGPIFGFDGLPCVPYVHPEPVVIYCPVVGTPGTTSAIEVVLYDPAGQRSQVWTFESENPIPASGFGVFCNELQGLRFVVEGHHMLRLYDDGSEFANTMIPAWVAR